MSAFTNSETAYSFITAIFFFIILQTVPHIYSGYTGHQFLVLVKNSDLYRNLFLMLSIWFIISYTEKSVTPEEIESNVWERILLTLLLFIFIMLFSRQEALYNSVELSLLFIIYVLYQVKQDNTSVDTSALEYASYAIFGLFILILISGYYRYMMLKIRQKGRRFSILKFIFGMREVEYVKQKPKTYLA